MFLAKIDIRPIITDHVETLRDYGTQKRSFGDLCLFLLLPLAIGGFAVWKGVRIHVSAVSGLLTAFAIFVGLLPNLLLMVLTFLQTTRGEAADSFLQIRKRFLREIAANLSFSILIGLALVTVAIVSLVSLASDQDHVGPVSAFLLVTGSVCFVLTLLMLLRRIYALVLNEFDRHKLNRAA